MYYDSHLERINALLLEREICAGRDLRESVYWFVGGRPKMIDDDVKAARSDGNHRERRCDPRSGPMGGKET